MPLEAYGETDEKRGIPFDIVDIIQKLVRNLRRGSERWLEIITEALRKKERPDAKTLLAENIEDMSTDETIWLISSYFGTARSCYSQSNLIHRFQTNQPIRPCKKAFLFQPINKHAH